MTKILIVDDEEKIRDVVKEYAKASEIMCDEASDGDDALTLIKDNEYDVIILDIMMPRVDGFSVLKELRSFAHTPVIMLSARQEEHDKLTSFDLGVDDYVTKPFSPKELMARVKAIYDRSKGAKHISYTFKGLEVDITARVIKIDGEKINVTPKEFDLLVFLINHENQALSRDLLLDKVWNYNYYGDYRTVDTHIKMLRQNIGKYRDFIVTVRGIGYKFEVVD